jgi:hypothetical protein
MGNTTHCTKLFTLSVCTREESGSSASPSPLDSALHAGVHMVAAPAASAVQQCLRCCYTASTSISCSSCIVIVSMQHRLAYMCSSYAPGFSLQCWQSAIWRCVTNQHKDPSWLQYSPHLKQQCVCESICAYTEVYASLSMCFASLEVMHSKSCIRSSVNVVLRLQRSSTAGICCSIITTFERKAMICCKC